MKRDLLAAVLSVTLAGAGTAAEKTIEARTTTDGGVKHFWQPKAETASVGDVLVWKMGAGSGTHTHGVRITNWAAVKGHVDVETVSGQQPFNATTGRNDTASGTDGQVLLRLKIKTVPPMLAKIEYNCIIHGGGMAGSVTIAPAEMATVKKIEAKSHTAWEPNSVNATVGEFVEWKMGAGSPGSHGVRITNWAAVKAHVEIVPVVGQQPFNEANGRNDNPTTTAEKVLVRFKIKSVPPAPGEITFNCIVHGDVMSGKVTVTAGP